MSTTKSNSNGQERKTLASQLDRLDAILDTLGEGLNEAVASAVQEAVETAVREGVHQSVRGALSEVLSNPEVLAVLRAALAPELASSQTGPATPVPPAPQGVGFFGQAAIGQVAGQQQGVGQAAGLLEERQQTPLGRLGVVQVRHRGESDGWVVGWLGGWVVG